MSLSPFEYRFGVDQGRIMPVTHTVSPEDNPGPAVLVTLATEPFPLEDGENLLISINGGLTQQVIFQTADFVDIGAATAAEVAAVLTAQLNDVTIDITASAAVRVTTVRTGLSATLKISGGTAQNAIQFPTDLVTGTQGVWSYVLGHDRPGQVFNFNAGDNHTITQTALFNDAKILRLRGLVRWRNGGTPAGYTWTLRMGPINGYSIPIIDSSTYLINEFLLDDFALNLTGLPAAPTAVNYSLTIEDTGGGAGKIETELPAAFLDFMVFDENANALELANRFPYPNQTGVGGSLPTLQFTVLNTTANALDLTATRIVIDDTIVFDAGAFLPPFGAGTVTPTTGTSGRDTNFVIPLTPLAPFVSEQPIVVRVITETAGSVDTLVDQWTFFMADTRAPGLSEAQAQDKTVVRVFFTEAVLMDSSASGALNTGNYTITPITVPAYNPTVLAVTQVSDQSVDVTVDEELTFGAQYQVTVTNVEDTSGNPINISLSQVSFLSFSPPAVPGRSFDLWNYIPPKNVREDEIAPNRPLLKFILILQDVVNLLLCDIDAWTEIIDIDLAPEDFLDAILRDLGNPFDFIDLTLVEKRRLARILVDIYKQKGTAPGIINAIRFFTGIEVELDIINCRDYWKIGVNLLGVDTVIGPGEGSPLWYSFYIVSPIILTDEQRDQMLKITDYMKPAHEHILGIQEPGNIFTPKKFWVLGVDTLGVTTVLGA